MWFGLLANVHDRSSPTHSNVGAILSYSTQYVTRVILMDSFVRARIETITDLLGCDTQKCTIYDLVVE